MVFSGLLNLEDRTRDVPKVRAGMYLLYTIDKQGFEKIRQELSGDDFFLHDALRYPHQTSWMPSAKENVHVWMHYYGPGEQSGASKILGKMSPDRTGEMKFLNAWNTGISLEMDEQGRYTSAYSKKK